MLKQYHELVKESGQVGIDILLTGQWPLNISCSIDDPKGDLEAQRGQFKQQSESLQNLVEALSPRYIYSSHGDEFLKREPFISADNIVTRFIGLGSLPGKHKPKDSKTTYI